MRLRTSLLTTSLLLVALSLPPAGAEPVPDECSRTTVGFPDGVVVLREDCTAFVGLAMTCAPPSHTTIQRGLVGGHDVLLSVCDGGLGTFELAEPIGSILPAASTSAPGCQPGGFHVETVLGGVYVGVDENCRPDVRHNGGPLATTAAAPGCDPFGTHAETVLGGVYVGVDEACRPDVRHNGGLGTTAAAPGCPPQDQERIRGLRVEVEHNCRVHVTVGDCPSPTTTEVSGHTVTQCLARDAAASGASAAGTPPRCDPDDLHVDTFFGGVAVGVGLRCTPSVNIAGNPADPIVAALCPGDVYVGGGLGVDFDDDCVPHATGDVDNACLGGGGSTKVLYDDGYLRVAYTSCPNHLPDITTTSTAAAAPSCEKVPGTTVRDDCAVYLRFMECVWGGYYRPVVEQGWVRVYVYTCGPPPTTSASSAEPCPATGTGGLNTVRLHDDCTAEVGVLDGAYCVNGGRRVERDVAGHTVRVLVCDIVGPAASPAAADPFPTCIREPCGPQVPTLPTPPTAPCSKLATSGGAGATYELDEGCNLVVEVKLYDCVWNGRWHSRTVGPVTVRVYECSGPDTTSSMRDPFPTCIRECSPVPDRDCTGPLQAIGSSDPVSLTVRDDCTVDVGVLDGVVCVGGWASTVERDVAGNTVRVTVCDGGLGHRLGDIIQPTT